MGGEALDAPKDVCCRGEAATKEKARRPAPISRTKPPQPACHPSAAPACEQLWYSSYAVLLAQKPSLKNTFKAVGRCKARLSKHTKHPQCPSCNSGGEGRIGAHHHTTVHKASLCRSTSSL